MDKIEWKATKGFVDYDFATKFMEERIEGIIEKKEKELIWFLEHNSIYTAGTGAKNEELLDKKFPIYKTGRGGKYTYHGPGQRIVYVMMDLKERSKPNDPDLHQYIYNLEEWIIISLEEFGIRGERRKGRVGIWVQDNKKDFKIAAIGIRVKKWVTYHGFAINLRSNLEHYSGIIPCGLDKFGVTSFEKLGIDSTYDELDLVLKKSFSKIYLK
jgi:lipoyl(octanoyl) transferase